MLRALFILYLSAAPAFATCLPPSVSVLSCQIEGGENHLTLCEMEETLVYRFGPKDDPELTLTGLKSDLLFTPWTGLGRDIWESVTFENGSFQYDVWASLDKVNAIEDPDNARQGGVAVYEGANLLAALNCLPSTIEYQAFGIEDAIR